MQFIDTHNHIYLDEFNEDRGEVLLNAKKQKVEKILLLNIDSTSLEAMNKVAEKYPRIFHQLIGLHPTSVEEDYLKEIELVEKELQSGKYIGVGEIGIDLYWDKTFKDEQLDAFEKQLKLAKKYELPVAIHSREAFPEVFEVMDRVNDEKLSGVFHAFSGDIEQAKKCLSYGFKLGIGGVVTYKKSNLSEVISQLKPEDIILETDSPYLAPVPRRGRRNEPAYIYYTAKKVAESFGISVEEIADITTKSAKELFSI